MSGATNLPAPAFAGGTLAITTTPVVGSAGRDYPEVFVPGDEDLQDGELRVTVLGSGNPWVTRAQSSSSSWPVRRRVALTRPTEEIRRIAGECDVKRSNVYLIPTAAKGKELASQMEWLEELSRVQGYRFAPRPCP